MIDDTTGREIVKKEFHDKTSNIFRNTLVALAEGITGIASSSKKDLILSIGHIFQRLRGGQFLSQLSNEWNKYKEAGKIKDDYEFSEQHKVCLHELLDFLDKDIPDQMRFDLLKKIFILSAVENNSDSILPQLYMKVCRNISSGSILILNAAYQITKERSLGTKKYKELGASGWIDIIKEKSGLRYRSLVEIYEQELMEKRLISPREYSDRSGITIEPHFRLTDLGFNICSYIDNYEKI